MSISFFVLLPWSEGCDQGLLHRVLFRAVSGVGNKKHIGNVLTFCRNGSSALVSICTTDLVHCILNRTKSQAADLTRSPAKPPGQTWQTPRSPSNPQWSLRSTFQGVTGRRPLENTPRNAAEPLSRKETCSPRTVKTARGLAARIENRSPWPSNRTALVTKSHIRYK